MYRSLTHGIQVTVEPVYLEDESSPSENHYFWAYTVEIVNQSDEAVQLRARHWKITDAFGRVEEVRGAGVVGEEPTLAPGERFEYTSGCPLSTASGIMIGTYQMEGGDGEMFSVDVPAFSLDLPDTPRVLN